MNARAKAWNRRLTRPRLIAALAVTTTLIAAAPASAAHDCAPHARMIAQWCPDSRAEFERGYDLGIRDGYAAGLSDARFGRPFCGEPPVVDCTTKYFRRGFRHAYRDSYAEAFAKGRCVRRTTWSPRGRWRRR